ncbi:MAG: hypothetical protein ACRDF0_03825, partial [Candidatus Limnocylindria bacterium]
MTTFRVGINYWPISSAMAWWRRFDRAEVERDFALIRAAGFDSVRVFLLWEDFQPAPGRVAVAPLAHLVAVADAAERAGLSLVPTLFTGHMSGVNWIPPWALGAPRGPSRFRVVAGGAVVDAAIRNWYDDPEIVAAQEEEPSGVDLILPEAAELIWGAISFVIVLFVLTKVA